MRLTSKWLLWFGGIGLYVMFLGGVYYNKLFNWTFDEKLKSDIIEMVKYHTPVLRNGLLRSQKALTLDEYDIMSTLSKDDRIASILYLNRAGVVRWHKESRFINVPWDEFQKNVGVPTNAVEYAYRSKTAKIRMVDKQPIYEIAIPLSVRGDIIGIVDLQVSRRGAEDIVNSAMRRYVFGAAGVLFLLGIPLYIFLHHFVISPVALLRDSIDTISTKTFEFRFPARKDELGDLADSLAAFMRKVKADMEAALSRDKQHKVVEQQWWSSVLGTVVPQGQHAIVVDEDNNVLYANFELSRGDPAQRLHLLDVVDSQQQNLLRLIGSALETPNQLVEGETIFKGENCWVKILHLDEGAETRRTLVLFVPKPGISL
ncbi:MAG: hypothetical protein ABIG11_07840 [bacterium]